MMDVGKSFSCLCFGIVLCAAVAPCLAADSDVTVNATIVASPCTVDDGSATQDVYLGKFWTSSLAHAGDATDWAAFDISLSHCPVSTQEVTATFSGQVDSDFPAYYLNTGNSLNVAIEVMDAAGKQSLGVGQTLKASVTPDGKANFQMKGRMISPQGKATSGTVAGTMEVSLTYR